MIVDIRINRVDVTELRSQYRRLLKIDAAHDPKLAGLVNMVEVMLDAADGTQSADAAVIS